MDRDGFLEAVNVSKKRDRADREDRPRVSREDAKRCIQEIRAFYQLGRDVRQSKDSIASYAEESGHKPGKLTVARLFAGRYTAREVETLCNQVERRCPAFGISHLGILLTVTA